VSEERPLNPPLSPQAGQGGQAPIPSPRANEEVEEAPARREGEGRRSFVVAIDGPAASGKGTLGQRLAKHFGFAHLDTGALYRATARLVLDAAGDPADPLTAEAAAHRVDPRLLEDPRLRGDEVAAAASMVAAIPEVRHALLALQQNFAAHPPPPARGAILDGRDIGTIICPEADVKLFVTASTQARARRRVKELREQGAAAIYEDVLQDLTLRDTRDSKRRAAPLAVAPDAKVIDTTMLDADIVFQCASELVARTLKEKEWQ
jgi:CMP/dCMP kinase